MEFPQNIAFTTEETECGTEAFEVTASNGRDEPKLIHSKTHMSHLGHKKCQTDEELDNIIAKVQEMM